LKEEITLEVVAFMGGEVRRDFKEMRCEGVNSE
jgi:hypothetical protein